jgi:hypothetical protein
MIFSAIIPQDLRTVASPTFVTLTLTGGLVISIDAITTDTTLTSANFTVLIDASGGNVTASLPVAPATGQIFNLKCIDASNTATVSGNGKNVDGAASMTLDLHESITVQYNGTEWWII